MNNDSASRIVAAVRDKIRTAPPGARLPSTRELVAEFGASPVTVQKALRTLAAQGLIDTRPGVGTFAVPPRTARRADYGWQTAALGSPSARSGRLSATQRASTPDTVRLHSGYPTTDLLPSRLVRAALTRAARTEQALTPAPAAGLADLQAWFAAQVAADSPAGITPPAPRDVIVTPGSQSALSSIFRALVGPGAPLLVESPTYWGAILAAEQTGVELVPVPTTPHGPDPDDLARAFDRSGARAFYAQPTFANPTGGQWSAETAESVLDVVRRHGAFLIEDDWAHDFGIDADPQPLVSRDGDGHVVHIRSLTKSVSPALRVAAVIARGPARDRLLADRAAEAMYVSGVLQAAVLDVVTQPGWDTHLRRLRPELRLRRDRLLEALRAEVPQMHVEHVPAGGLNLWARLPEGVDVDGYVRACEAGGVLIAPGSEWFPAEPTGAFVRLNFAGEAPERFSDGARILGETLRAHLPRGFAG